MDDDAQKLNQPAPTNVSKPNNKIVFVAMAVVVALLLVGGLVAYKKFSRQNLPQASVVNSANVRATPSSSPSAPYQTPNAQNSSDSALNQDANSIQSNLNNLNSNLNSVDQQFNSQSNDSNIPQ